MDNILTRYNRTINSQYNEFDTEEDAIFFMESIMKNTGFDMTGAYTVADILYYDGGYIDGTGCFINTHDFTRLCFNSKCC